MCGVFNAIGSAFNAVGSFLGSPVGKIATAVVTDAIAIATLNPFAIVAAVGSTLGAVGAVTGNQTLSTIGTVIGAVGGIGGLANAAGLIDVSDVFGSDIANATSGGLGGWMSGGAGAAGGSGGVATDTGSFGLSGAPTTGYDFADNSGAFGGLGSGGQPPSIVDGITGQLQGVTPTVDTAAAPSVTPTVAADGTMGTASGSSSARADIFGDPTTPAAATDQAATTTSSGGSPPAMTTPASPATGVANPMDAGIPGSSTAAQNAAAVSGKVTFPTPPSTWGTISNWIEGHPSLALGALMAGGSFLSGATSPLTPAQVTALNAQAEQNQAAANYANQQTQLLQRQQANMAQPLPVASRSPTGLINMPRLAPVTGQVA